MNPVVKRTFTGLFVGAIVICAVLFAPKAAIRPVVGCLIALAVVEYVLLLKKKVATLGIMSVLCSPLSRSSGSSSSPRGFGCWQRRRLPMAT